MLIRGGGLAALLAVVGPGILAGLSDDDPAGITTYSILGAKYGYELLWVLALSTVALIVFHELGVRMGIVTGKGLMALVREHSGPGAVQVVLGALVIANLGTLCAEFAGVAAGMDLLSGLSRYVSVPLAGLAVSLLVLRGSFKYVEHVLLALSTIFVAYILSGVLAHPDWGATLQGTVKPSIPLNREAILVAVATIGTTLAPWGLAFIQSYAVDKRLKVKDLRYERVDVIVGAVLTGVIGLFVVIACAATLHIQGIKINDASDAARALEPLAGNLAATLFGLGFLGAALLAAAIVPLSTAYSVAEAFGRECDIDDKFDRSPGLLPQLRRDRHRRRRDCPRPRSAADPDPLSLASAERRPLARHPALHAPLGQEPRDHGRARLERPRPSADRGGIRSDRPLGRRPGGVDGGRTLSPSRSISCPTVPAAPFRMESGSRQENLEPRLLQAPTSAAGGDTTGRTRSLMAPLNFPGSSTKGSWLEYSNHTSCFEGAVNASK